MGKWYVAPIRREEPVKLAFFWVGVDCQSGWVSRAVGGFNHLLKSNTEPEFFVQAPWVKHLVLRRLQQGQILGEFFQEHTMH